MTTNISKLPNVTLNIVFEYDSFPSINPALNQVCKQWHDYEKVLAGRKWTKLKEKSIDYPRLLARINKIETSYFSSEGAISCFGRFVQRIERALILNGVPPDEITYLRNRDSTLIDFFSSMDYTATRQRNQNLKTFWSELHSATALPISAIHWDATQIRSWLEGRGNVNGITSIFGGAADIRGVPPELGQFTSLERLNFVGNHITFLPSTMGNLSSLESLDIRDNPLRKLSDEIGNLFNNEHFKLILDKTQFLRFYDQLNRICPETAWYLKLFNSIVLFCIHLYLLLDRIIHCGFKPAKDHHIPFYTRDEIAALDATKINQINIQTPSFLCSWDTFFSERRFEVRFKSEGEE